MSQHRLHALFTLACFVLSATALVAEQLYPWHPAPFGWLAVACLIWPGWRFVAWLRSDSEVLRRIDYGLCRDCGYDIRQSIGHCPECGRRVKPHEGVRLRAGAN